MSAAANPSEADETYLHPRENPDFTGHGDAEKTLLDAFNSGRLAHAWLITGPRGVGKATLAYRFARHVLATGGAESPGSLFADGLPENPGGGLYLAPDDPVFLRVASRGHADFLAIERSVNPKTGKLRTEIVVDDVRTIGGFLNLTPAEGGWRVVVIDCADDMNRSSANAVLKVLEEPPKKALILLVAHAPGRLLPTIRSRCRKLALKPLADETVISLLGDSYPELAAGDLAELARLGEGSIGRALELQQHGGLELYRELAGILGTLPDPDIGAMHALAGKVGRAGADQAFQTFGDLLRAWLGRLILSVSTGNGAGDASEDALFARLGAHSGLDRWLEVWDKSNHLLARTDAINLDRRAVAIDILLALANAARQSP